MLIRYAIAGTPHSAERAMNYIGEYAFRTLPEAAKWLDDHPTPHHYSVWKMSRQPDGMWIAEPTGDAALPRVNSLGAMGVV